MVPHAYSMSLHNKKPCHIPLKCKCPIKRMTICKANHTLWNMILINHLAIVTIEFRCSTIVHKQRGNVLALIMLSINFEPYIYIHIA